MGLYPDWVWDLSWVTGQKAKKSQKQEQLTWTADTEEIAELEAI